jgi:predicted transposase YdaD
MMTLPKELQRGLVTKIKHLEEEKKMPFISPTEELAMERGEQKGIQQGIQQGIQREQQLIIRLLNRRVGEIESSLIDTIRTLDIDQLESLGEALLDFSSVTDLEQWLQNKSES